MNAWKSVLLGACATAPPPAPPAQSAPAPVAEAPRPQPKFGTFGFDVAGMDKAVAPGDDFFEHANGTWAKTTEIPADRGSYNTFALARQYTTYEPLPGLHLNGEQVLGENIADLAGLATAYDAYHLSLKGAPAPVIDGFTADQRFYFGWAQNYRSKYREAALRRAVLTGVHSPGMYRAQTVRNQDPWYGAFDVKPGQGLHLAPADRVKIW